MIPLDSAAVILRRMPNASTAADDFPLTIIKAPVVDVKCYRLLRSRHHRRNSSASPVRSLLPIKTECEESSPERDDVLDAKDLPCPQHADTVFLSHTDLSTCLLSNVHVKCTDKFAYLVRENVVSSAKRDEAPITERSSVSLTSTLSPCETSEGEKSVHLLKDCSTETKGKVVCVSPVRLTKRAHRKSTRLKKTVKKKVKSLKRRQGAGDVFTRLALSHGKKNLSGLACRSKEQEQQKVYPSVSNDSEANYLNIQKVCEAYAPKKNPNKVILLPKVFKRSLRKEASAALSPRKWNGGSCVPLSSPCRERDINTASDDQVKKKIYLSETHSGMMAGVPCVPPCTPTVDQLKNVEYILSLTDVKSQRAVKAKLSSLENKMKTEEQRRKEKAIQEEQKRTYGAVLQLKQRQRAEIYALNKVMTCLENENFRKFMERTSVETLPV